MGSSSFDLRNSLAELGWSQAQLAERLGVWPETVTRWHGARGIPQYAVAYLEMALMVKRLSALVGKQ